MENLVETMYIVYGYKNNSSSYITNYVLGMYPTIEEAIERQKEICGENYKENVLFKNSIRNCKGTFTTFLNVLYVGDMDHELFNNKP